jgi:hypothetical protein
VNLEARTWTILETKNGEPHIVPLSRQAIELLRSRFPIDGTGNPKHPEPDVLVFATSNGASLGDWDRETKVLQKPVRLQAGTAMTSVGPEPRCLAKWGSCLILSKPH